MRFIGVVYIACLLCWVPPAAGQSGSLASDGFGERVIDAAERRAARDLEAFVQDRRLEVKPIVEAQLTASIRAALRGDAAEAERTFSVARSIAGAFARVFGEQSLSNSVGYVAGWSRAQKERKLRADSLYQAGTALRGSKETRDQAHTYYLEALQEYRALGDRVGEGTVLGGLGVVFWYVGHADSTLKYFEDALAVRKAADDRHLVGNSLNDLGSVNRVFFKDHARARDYYAEAVAVREEIGDDDGLGRTLTYLAFAHEVLGDLEKALLFNDRSVAVNERIGETSRMADALNNSGIVLKNMGRYSEALERFERTLALREAGGQTDRMVDVLNWIGVVHRWLGDFEAALANYREVIRLATEAGDGRALAHGYSNTGVVFLTANRPERAAPFFERAIEQFLAVGDEASAMSATLNLGSSLLYQGDYAAAEPRLLEALEASRRLKDRLNEGNVLILLGHVMNRAGRFDDASDRYGEGLALGQALGVPDMIWAARLGFGDNNERRGDYRAAIAEYEKAFEVLERVRGALRTEDEKANFLAQQRFAYEAVVDLIARLHGAEPEAGFDQLAFRYAEQAKARAFLDLLAEALANVRAGVAPELLEQQGTLLANRTRVKQQLEALASQAEADEAVQVALLADAAALDEEYRTLQREMYRQNPRYSALQYPTPATLDEIQSDLLPDDVVLLEYALGDSSTTLWAVTADERALYRLPRREEIEEQVELLRFALSDPTQGSPARFAGMAHRLYEMLMEPAAAYLQEGRRLVIVPDGALFYLPFEALLTEAADGAAYAELPYLIRRHAVSYGQSASVLKQLRAERQPIDPAGQMQLLAFGDPDFGAEDDPQGTGLGRLAYSGTEVEQIAQLFAPGRTDVFLRGEASEARVKGLESLENYRYIHFATHGLVDERRPDFSSVVLAHAGGEDGLLQAAEIFNLRLNADLIVLSACETGIGKMVRGEGLVGLSRAFMYAGTPSLVVSLWSVADLSTAHLMERFYEHLVAHERAKTEALRNAKLALLEEEALAHPFHWAPFILIGDWE